MILTHDEENLLRVFTLVCAFLIDNSEDITLADSLLTFLYEHMKKNKDDVEETTFTMVCHLLGALLKSKPKTKGEGIAMMEYAKLLRETQETNEKMFFLLVPVFNFQNDYDEETLKYISNQANTISSSSYDSNYNKFL